MSNKHVVETYTTFSGADAVVYADNVLFGETSAIRWTEYPDRHLEGYLLLTLFDAGSVQRLKQSFLFRGTPLNYLKIAFDNDYGQKMEYKIHSPEFLKAEGGVSMDDIIMQEKIYFTAESLEVIDPDQKASKNP